MQDIVDLGRTIHSGTIPKDREKSKIKSIKTHNPSYSTIDTKLRLLGHQFWLRSITICVDVNYFRNLNVALVRWAYLHLNDLDNYFPYIVTSLNTYGNYSIKQTQNYSSKMLGVLNRSRQYFPPTHTTFSSISCKYGLT